LNAVPSCEPLPAAPRDLAAWDRDIAALRAEMEAAIGPEDLAHLQKLERWGRLCTALGYATAWIAPNPLSALLMAHGSTVRWTIVSHHCAHRAYDRVPGVPERYRGRTFAMGRRRFADWLDWMVPEAWRLEHNALHHVRTSEPGDPDLVQQNVDWLRRSRLPRPVKVATIALLACTWKLTYYAPNTFQIWRQHLARRPGEPAPERFDDIQYLAPFDPTTELGRSFYLACVLPYAATRFVAIPLLFAPLGPLAVANVLANSVLAEVLTNVETFVLITPNHAADDLPCFAGRPASRGEHTQRQVAGTVNYATSGDFMGFLHGFMNYHIEHHLFPDMPVLKYQQYQDRLRAICKAHGVPYKQESVFARARKTLEVMIGAASMRSEP
jgi:fatty acid desaturase